MRSAVIEQCLSYRSACWQPAVRSSAGAGLSCGGCAWVTERRRIPQRASHCTLRSACSCTNERRPHASGRHRTAAVESGQSPPVWGAGSSRSPLQTGSGNGSGTMPHARWGKSLGRAPGRPQRQFQAWGLDSRERELARAWSISSIHSGLRAGIPVRE
jgi:hypothetical protein